MISELRTPPCKHIISSVVKTEASGAILVRMFIRGRILCPLPNGWIVRQKPKAEPAHDVFRHYYGGRLLRHQLTHQNKMFYCHLTFWEETNDAKYLEKHVIKARPTRERRMCRISNRNTARNFLPLAELRTFSCSPLNSQTM